MTIAIEFLFTPGCRRWAGAASALKAVAEGFGTGKVAWHPVNPLEEPSYAMALGLTTPPAIAIDGELTFPQLPTAERLREELTQRLQLGAGRACFDVAPASRTLPTP